MPLRPARVGRVGVIGAPVAKTAVVAKAVTPGPAPVAKTAVVAAAVTPGRRGGSSALQRCGHRHPDGGEPVAATVGASWTRYGGGSIASPWRSGGVRRGR